MLKTLAQLLQASINVKWQGRVMLQDLTRRRLRMNNNRTFNWIPYGLEIKVITKCFSPKALQGSYGYKNVCKCQCAIRNKVLHEDFKCCLKCKIKQMCHTNAWAVLSSIKLYCCFCIVNGRSKTQMINWSFDTDKDCMLQTHSIHFENCMAEGLLISWDKACSLTVTNHVNSVSNRSDTLLFFTYPFLMVSHLSAVLFISSAPPLLFAPVLLIKKDAAMKQSKSD